MNRPATLRYKGYRAKPEYYPDDKIYYGTLIGIRDMVDFQSDDEENIEKEFHSAVDDYLEFCKSIGKEPEREFDGLILLQIPPELHMDICMYAEGEDVTINKAIEQAIRAMVHGSTDDKKEAVMFRQQPYPEKDNPYELERKRGLA